VPQGFDRPRRISAVEAIFGNRIPPGGIGPLQPSIRLGRRTGAEERDDGNPAEHHEQDGFSPDQSREPRDIAWALIRRVGRCQ